MAFDRREMIEKLKLEISMIRGGRYNPSVHEPRVEPRVFRESITCLNVGLPDNEKREPCERCFLISFVPPEHRGRTDPCHYIPLNEQGDTVDALAASGDKDRLAAALLGWLERTVAELEKGTT